MSLSTPDLAIQPFFRVDAFENIKVLRMLKPLNPVRPEGAFVACRSACADKVVAAAFNVSPVNRDGPVVLMAARIDVTERNRPAFKRTSFRPFWRWLPLSHLPKRTDNIVEKHALSPSCSLPCCMTANFRAQVERGVAS
ncbi:hypothetical protein [Labrenzia sp. R5_0]|uniref:hypothetical protein n=1 Tax=Labrenzia sp. R5_0 TaxID=2821108 RepID=UPI001ADCF374|nr:hypothetical protein [Labrenzia sp. R5_0]MBO9457933.1 hypothetical protein [Labrenzia sp. R5_0]